MASIDELQELVKQAENTEGYAKAHGLNPDEVVSPAGAVGLYQVMPSTAEELGYDPSRLKEHDYNKEVSRAYIERKLLPLSDDPAAVLVGYNAGPGRMSSYLASGGDTSRLPKETQGYLNRVSDLVSSMKNANPPINEMWEKMSAARSHGYSWDQISQAFNQKRQEALDAGYTPGDVNQAFGLPRDYQWEKPTADATRSLLSDAAPPSDNPQTPKPPQQSMIEGLQSYFDESVLSLEEAAKNVKQGLGPAWKKFHDYMTTDEAGSFAEDPINRVLLDYTPLGIATKPIRALGYAVPDLYNLPTALGPIVLDVPRAPIAGDVLHNYGWETSDAHKVFGSKFVNGFNAAIEVADGIPKSPEEVAGLKDEASATMSVLGTAAKKEYTIPTPQNILDAATRVKEDVHAHFPELEKIKDVGAPPESQEPSLNDIAKVIGHDYVSTGQAPDVIAQSYMGNLDLLRQSIQRIADDESGALKIGTGESKYPFEPAPLPITPETIRSNNPALTTRLADEWRMLISPEMRGPLAYETHLTLRDYQARTFNDVQRVAIDIRNFGRTFAELSNQERLDYIDHWEAGDMSSYPVNSALKRFYDVWKPALDDLWSEMDTMGIAPNYIQNYMRHFWVNPSSPNVMRFFQQMASGSFRKERTFATLREGMEAGLRPLSLNPVEVVLRSFAEQRKFLNANYALKDMVDRGMIFPEATLRGGVLPNGWNYIDPRIARLGKQRYIAPEEVATLFNRAYEPGLDRFTTYRLVRNISNMGVQSLLAFNGFHFLFESSVAVWSGIAQSMKQISRLTPSEMLRGLATTATSVSKPYTYPFIGGKIIKEGLGLKNYGGPIPEVADALLSGGMRFGQEPVYSMTPYGSFWNSFRGSLQKMAGKDTGRITFLQDVAEMYRDQMVRREGSGVPKIALATFVTAAQMIPRIMATAMAPLFEKFVPAMKVGAAAELLMDEMRVNPRLATDYGMRRAVAARISNSIDNRFGQLVYDNTAWHSLIKQIGPLATISLGWQAGTLRELPGGILDLSRGRIPAGQLRELSDRAAAVVAFPIAIAMLHMVYGVIKGTYNSNWTTEDYMHPPTGGQNQDGSPTRASTPFYDNEIYKIIIPAIHGNLGGAVSGLASEINNPLWKSLGDMINNQDWMGAAIADPNDGLAAEAGDYIKFYAKQMGPIVLQNLKTLDPEANISTVETLFGIRKANEEFNQPEEYQNFQEKNLIKRLRLRAIEKQREDEAEDKANAE